MWQYNHYDELMHYGVVGMKWGVRKKALRASISILEAKRRRDEREYKKEQWRDATRGVGNPATRKKLEERQKQHKSDDATAAWRISQQKAKLDPKYKDSAEYKSSKRNYGQEVTKKIIRDLITPQKKKNF